MSEIGSVILVDGQTQTTLEAAEMVFEEIGVFGEIDCFERKFAETLATVCVGCGLGCDTTATEFGASAIL
jgi:hypothetical protein